MSSYFTNYQDAKAWASTYGLPYPYSIELLTSGEYAGQYLVTFHTREPKGC